MNYYIGIDLGTSSVKMLMMTGEGDFIKSVTKGYPLHFPKSGWAEQNPADWWEAVLEGVAFAIRDSVEVARSLGVKITRSTICGGGAKSPLWCEIMANVLNIEVVTLEKEEGPAMGGAMLAAVGCGEYADVYEAAEMLIKEKKVYCPIKATAEKYEMKYKKFTRLYPAVKGLF